MQKIFTELSVKGLTLKNRIMMAPMCMFCASENAMPSRWHLIHYATRAIGGVGLIMVEGTGIAPEGRLNPKDLGLWDDIHVEGMRELVDVVHNYGAKIGIQLNHAGRKSEVPGVQMIAPSPIPYQEGRVVPKEMTKSDIAYVVDKFKSAVMRADKAGFDTVQIHAAHGYLLNQFLSPLTNHRQDEYGGSPENRVRILGEVLDAAQSVWPDEKPLQVRVTAEDYQADGNHAEDMAALLNIVKDKGIDFVDVSTGGVVPVVPETYPGYQVSQAETIKKNTRLPVAAGGLLTDAKEINGILEKGQADMIFLGRELLRNPYWVLKASKELEYDLEWPEQYKRAK